MRTALDYGVILASVAILAAVSFRLRRRSAWVHLAVWLVGYPAAYFAVAILTMLIAFQVFGVDLMD
ncbi:MAG: hypothetical protein IT538_11635 [Variibacter sp.]|nr:hypothetical protein [Variibacter sp.]